MKDFEPLMIPHVRLVDEASRAIREVILTGELPPGSQLRQADLAQKMKISRTPLREALMKLEQEGLIASSWGASDNNRKAKFYRLTRAGRKQIERDTRQWEATSAIMTRFLAPSEEP